MRVAISFLAKGKFIFNSFQENIENVSPFKIFSLMNLSLNEIINIYYFFIS